ncbi:PAS domain S-box protein [Terrimonas sp. NA20]|uniref:PAS domain S-box protein n=1 Tax=Terrimonas ginsenosidimutans TaxID=2908004 RepID=A0ABS9KLB5_9BACT|nr:PAS domain S-box protein [Terrimonas ginsenosidimutans]MCG2613118.1 PAS domain S-box protein [Terrimonas ginsenosidimutans]
MQLPPDLHIQQRLRRWSGYLNVGIGAIAALVLIGWNFDISLLKSLSTKTVAMNPTSAVCFVLASLSFFWRTRRQKTGKINLLAQLFAIIITAIAAIILINFLIDTGIRPDGILFNGAPENISNTGSPNRMAPNTATCFLLTGVSLLLLHYESRKGRMFAHYVALIIGLISLLSLLGYLYQVDEFYGVFNYLAMALNTAICFFLFATAVFFSNPDAGFMKEFTSSLNGSRTARLLIPAAIIIPAALGLLRGWGQSAGIYSHEFGLVLYAAVTILIFVAITWYNAVSMNRRELQEHDAENLLRTNEAHTRAIFDNAPDAIVVIDENGTIIRWNKQAEQIFGWTDKEAIRQSLYHIIIPEDSRMEHKNNMKQFMLAGDGDIPGKTFDLRALRKNGSLVDVSLRISPLLLEDQRQFIGFIRDVTARKLLENTLKSFNDELSRQVHEKTAEITDIFERITDGFIALDENFRYTYMNTKAGQLIHMEPASLIGKQIWDVFPAAIGSATYKAFNEAMSTQQYISNTDYYEPLHLWQENHIYPSPKGLSVFIRDITEKKRAAQEITEARDLADKLIDSLPGVFYFYDQQGNFIKWNKQFEIVTGYSSEEIARMHPADFFPEDEREYITNRIMGVFEKGMNDAEAHFISREGYKIPYYFKAVKLVYEGEPCLLGTGIDITEIKKAEEKLRNSEQKYKLLFESNPLPMWMLSLPEYHITEVNTAALTQYGYTRSEFMALDIFNLRPDEDIERLKANTNRQFRGIYYAGTWRHKKKDGTILFVDIVTHDIYYEGKPTRLVLANEVTEQHLAEERLKDAYEQTRKLTDHLQTVREEERMHIAREIHDELGQLLTVLKMDVSWLNRKLQPTTEPIQAKLKDLLSLIDTTVKKVRHISSELRPSLLDDLGLVAALEWHIEEFQKRSGIELESNLPATELALPEPVKIGLFRILQESLTNVARHSGAERVIVTLLQKENTLFLTIEDNGKGFDAESSNKKTLGLLGMKERTLMIGGEYKITGIPGKGTIVDVSVPVPVFEKENR